MNKDPIQFEKISLFMGMNSDADPQNCAEETLYRQVNLLSVTNGTLTTRGGLQELTLDTLE